MQVFLDCWKLEAIVFTREFHWAFQWKRIEKFGKICGKNRKILTDVFCQLHDRPTYPRPYHK